MKEELYPTELTRTDRNLFGLALLDLALGHFIAICFLAKNRTDVDSALRSLMRPLVEALYRSAWLMFIATDEEIAKVPHDRRGEVFPKLGAIGTALDTRSGDTFFTTTLADLVTIHDFTHGGFQAFLRHFHEDMGIGPIHDPVEIATLVHWALVVVGRTAVFFTNEFDKPNSSLLIASLIARRVQAE